MDQDEVVVEIGDGSSINNRTRFSSQSLTSSYGLKYEYFQGKNNFYCSGRFMTAPKLRYCFLNFLLIVVTFGLFMVFDSPYLAKEVHLAIPIVAGILFICVTANMIRTTCSDPGIIPRASAQESEFLDKLYSVSNGDSTTFRPPPRTKDVVINGQTVKSKYCFTCKMFRPPRASHCGTCDNCVERFDHHCPFLGNCIGKRNYRSFYCFVVSLSFLAVVVLCGSVTHLALLSANKNMLEALRESPTSAVVILVSFFGMWTVIGLAGFHTYLICVEQTTNEDIKGIFGRQNVKNPYSQGSHCRNCCNILCGPITPSIIDPRGVATSEFIESLSQVAKPNTASSATNLSSSTAALNNQNQKQSVCRRNNGANTRALTSPTDPSVKITTLDSSAFSKNSARTLANSTVNSAINSNNNPSNYITNPNRLGLSKSNGQVGGGYKAGTFPDADNKVEYVPLNNKSNSKSNQRILLSHSKTTSNIITNGVGVGGLSSPTSSSSWQSSTGLHNGHVIPAVPSASSFSRLTYESESAAKQQLPVTATEQVVLIKNGSRKEDSSSDFELENMTMINSPLHLDSIPN